jgi:hypothetical protein
MGLDRRHRHRDSGHAMACAVLSRAGVVAMLVTIEASPEGIDQIMWVMRSSKLTGVAAASCSSHAFH